MRSENRAGLYHYSIMVIVSDSQDDFLAKNEPENLLNQRFMSSRSSGLILSGIFLALVYALTTKLLHLIGARFSLSTDL